MEIDDYSQAHPCYDGGSRPSPSTRRRGKLSREGERRKKAGWRQRNRSKYRAYMRLYMAERRKAQS